MLLTGEVIQTGRFVDYYTILKIPSDATTEMLWKAYEVRVSELEARDFSLEEKVSRRELLDRAIAVLGNEQQRIAYDINGQGGYFEKVENSVSSSLTSGSGKPEVTPASPDVYSDESTSFDWMDSHRNKIFLILKGFIVFILIVKACYLLFFSPSNSFLQDLFRPTGIPPFRNWGSSSDVELRAIFTTYFILWLLLSFCQMFVLRFVIMEEPLASLRFSSLVDFLLDLRGFAPSLFLFLAIMIVSSIVIPFGSLFLTCLACLTEFVSGRDPAFKQRAVLLFLSCTPLLLYFHYSVMTYDNDSRKNRTLSHFALLTLCAWLIIVSGSAFIVFDKLHANADRMIKTFLTILRDTAFWLAVFCVLSALWRILLRKPSTQSFIWIILSFAISFLFASFLTEGINWITGVEGNDGTFSPFLNQLLVIFRPTVMLFILTVFYLHVQILKMVKD